MSRSYDDTHTTLPKKKVSVGLREKRTSRDAVYAAAMARKTSAEGPSGIFVRVTTFPTELRKGRQSFEGKEEADWRRR